MMINWTELQKTSLFEIIGNYSKRHLMQMHFSAKNISTSKYDASWPTYVYIYMCVCELI